MISASALVNTVEHSYTTEKKPSFLTTELFLFSFLWPVMIFPKEVQFFALLLIAFVLVKKHAVTFDLLSFFLCAYLVLYAFSIFINVLIRSSETIRVLAAFNSLSIWMLAIVFYLVYKNIQLDMKKLIKIGFINYSVLILLWAVSLLIFSVTAMGKVSVLTRTLYYTETFNGEVVTRFVGFMDYSNLIVLFCLFFYPLYFMYIRQFKSKTIQFLFLAIGIFPLISSYSRSGYLVFGAAVAIGIVYYAYKTVDRDVFYFFSFLSLSVLLAFFFITDANQMLVEKSNELMTARAGSNDSREIILAESIQITKKESFFIGMGIKDNSSTGYPLGSHSTIMGFFYKTGIFGVLLGTWLFMLINLKILFLKSAFNRKLMSIFLFLMPLIFFVEDLDGANWLICLYFVFVAILLNDKNWRETECKTSRVRDFI